MILSWPFDSRAHACEIALQLDEGLSYEEWSKMGIGLQKLEGSAMWWLGDWLNYGELAYGEKYKDALEKTDYAYDTLRTAKYTAKGFAMDRRRSNLPWTFHHEVLSLDKAEQDQVLDLAETEKLSQAKLRTEVQRRRNRLGDQPNSQTCTTEDLTVLMQRGLTFGT